MMDGSHPQPSYSRQRVPSPREDGVNHDDNALGAAHEGLPDDPDTPLDLLLQPSYLTRLSQS